MQLLPAKRDKDMCQIIKKILTGLKIFPVIRSSYNIQVMYIGSMSP